MSCVLQTDSRQRKIVGGKSLREHAPSPVDPTDDVSTKSKRVGGIAQPTLRALEHGPLIHEVIEHFSALGEKIIQVRLSAL